MSSTNKVVSLLPRSFYEHSPEVTAKNLLGKVLVRDYQGQRLSGRIVETEAYFGLDDPAAHASAGRTPRNAVLFGLPGVAYVYFIYGMYYCLNVSCEPEGQAGCVLIRAIEPLDGTEIMAKLRHLPSVAKSRLLVSGPGRLCQALDITRSSHNGVDVTSTSSDLRIEDDGYQPDELMVTPRVGIRHAKDRLARFLIPGNPYISRKF